MAEAYTKAAEVRSALEAAPGHIAAAGKATVVHTVAVDHMVNQPKDTSQERSAVRNSVAAKHLYQSRLAEVTQADNFAGADRGC